MNITVWTEESKDKENALVRHAYPEGMAYAIADIFKNQHNVMISDLSKEDDGLSQSVLDNTDVLIYWAHKLHDKVSDTTVNRISDRVKQGMGIILLHSAHFSKIFKKLMGTSGSLKWREDHKHERIYNICPTHPIANGIPESFVLPKEEMYGEYFDIPTPQDIIFLGWFPKGELFRSGFTYSFGNGKIFYLQAGHETYPIYKNVHIRKIIFNATHWLHGANLTPEPCFIKPTCDHAKPKENGLFKPRR